jgi:PHD/YefM family antitoxin component YafN of YafNO toxin-antitoxin module
VGLRVRALSRTTSKRDRSRRHQKTILTASQARANLYRLIDQAEESIELVFIAGKRRSAALVSEEDWKAI